MPFLSPRPKESHKLFLKRARFPARLAVRYWMVKVGNPPRADPRRGHQPSDFNPLGNVVALHFGIQLKFTGEELGRA